MYINEILLKLKSSLIINKQTIILVVLKEDPPINFTKVMFILPLSPHRIHVNSSPHQLLFYVQFIF